MGVGENVGESVGQNTGSSGNDRSRPLPPVITSFTSTSSSVTVTWTNPNPYSVDSYNIYYYLTSSGTLYSSYTVIGTTSRHTITGLSSSTQYSVVMTCADGERESGLSNTETVTTESAGSFVPFKVINFESGVNGGSATASDMFQELAGDTTVTTEVPAAQGTKCGRFYKEAAPTSYPSGSDLQAGYGTWGGYISIPSITQEKEIWISWYYRWPSGYPFKMYQTSPEAGPGHLKYIRLGKSLGDGYYGIAIQDGQGVSYPGLGAYIMGSENRFVTTDGDYSSYTPMTRTDQWIRHELYIKVSSGSTGIMRMWQDGTLINEHLGSNIISGGAALGVQFHTWWNSPAYFPYVDGISYVDNIVIATSDTGSPAEQDSSGNYMIGTYGDVTPPPPPTPQGVVYSDNFSSGNIYNPQVNTIGGHFQNAFEYSGTGGVVSHPTTGHTCLKIPSIVDTVNGGFNSGKFEIFWNTPLPEIWVSWDMWFDSDFEMQLDSVGPAHHKMLALWEDVYGSQAGGDGANNYAYSVQETNFETANVAAASIQTTMDSPTYRASRYPWYLDAATQKSCCGCGYLPCGTTPLTPYAELLQPADLGKWVNLSYHVKVAQNSGEKGLYELYKDGVLVMSVDHDNYTAASPLHAYRRMYIYGNAGGGIVNQSNKYVKDFKISTPSFIAYDNFEDGQLNLGTPVSSGFYWLAVNSGSVNTLPPAIANTTSIGNSGTGTYGVKFYWDAAGFGGPNELSEFKYVLGGNYTDIWAAFDIYFPTDYKVDRLVTDSGQQKFFNFAHQPVIGGTAFVFEIMGSTSNPNDAYLRCNCPWNGSNQGAMHFWDRNTGGVKPNGDNYNEFQGWTSDSNYVLGFKKSEDAGQWRRFIFHAKIPTSGASNAYQSDYGGTLYGYGNDGVLEVWKDGTKIIQWTDANNYGNPPLDNPFYTGGYILGDKRIGYDRDTALYIDNVQFSTQALA